MSTPAQDGFRYRFETSPGDAQKALNQSRFPLTTPEFERQASTSPLPSPEVTAKVLDTVVEMSNDELVAAVGGGGRPSIECRGVEGQRRRRAAPGRVAHAGGREASLADHVASADSCRGRR